MNFKLVSVILKVYVSFIFSFIFSEDYYIIVILVMKVLLIILLSEIVF